jgi:hypothetical protein
MTAIVKYLDETGRFSFSAILIWSVGWIYDIFSDVTLDTRASHCRQARISVSSSSSEKAAYAGDTDSYSSLGLP